MEIADISAYALSSLIDPPQTRSFHGGVRTLYKRDFVLVVVDTADGERGFAPAGASSSAMREFFEGASQRSFASAVEERVGETLTGAEIYEPADVHDYRSRLDVPDQVAMQALSAIDVALHDIAGKRHGVPVYELLGDHEADPSDIPLYASAGMYMEPSGYARQAQLLEECGFFGYKYRPGIGHVGDRRTVERLREAVGEEMKLMADAHTWWKLRDATYTEAERREVINAYEEGNVYWLEEPVAPDDYDGYKTLAAETSVSLAGGESEPSPDGLRTLAATDAIEFLQGDVRHHGGFTGCYDVATSLPDSDMRFVPHNFGTWLGLVANAHLVAAVDEVDLLEYPVFERDPVLDAPGDSGMYPFDLAFDVIEGTVDVTDGVLSVPDEPGLGVEVNLDIVDQYPFVEGPWTTFEYDD